MNNKWKNYGLWVSIASLIGIILSASGVFKKLGWTDDTWNTITTIVFGILTTLGIISNPSLGKGYIDSNQEVPKEINPTNTTEFRK